MEKLKIKISMLLLLVFTTLYFAQSHTGTLKGIIVDGKTKERLIGTNIFIPNSQLGASSNENGEFEIYNIPVGSYVVTISYIGYQTVTKTDIMIRSDRTTVLNAELFESVIQSDEVVVMGGYFNSNELQSISSAGFNQEEIRRAPGAAGDISRMIAILPSVGQVADNVNDLIVRGGSPIENGFFIDNIQIPNINHFPVQGATGGAIGILNVNFIEDTEFNSGCFDASFGNRLSSITDIKFREGSRDAYYTQMDFSMGGIGGSIEGPFANKKGSVLLSAKKSYLDFIVDAIGTGVAPRYGDVQGKVVFDIDQNNKLTLIDVFGINLYKINSEEASDNGNLSFGKNEATQNTVGINWRKLWGQGYSNSSLSYSTLKTLNNWEKEGQLLQSENNFEVGIRIRNTNFQKITKSSDIEFGFDLENEYSDYNIYFGPNFDRLGNSTDEKQIIKRANRIHGGVFLNYLWNITDNLSSNFGVRGDYYNKSSQFSFSPRLSLAYRINDLISLKGSFGKYYQNLPLYLIAQIDKNNLKNQSATHFILGIDYMLTESTKLSIEAYRKDYKDFPLDPEDPTSFIIDDGITNNQFGNYGKLISNGKAFTQGIELLVQKKLAEDFYGIVSASVFKCRYEDYNGKWRDRRFDNQALFGIVGGYKPNDNWEYSVRWNIVGGVPYTPFDINLSQELNGGIIDKEKINSQRYPTYHNLNLRVDRSFYFNSTTLVVYLNLMNAYNRKNISMYSWDEVKKEQKAEYQWGLIPIIGVEYKF